MKHNAFWMVTVIVIIAGEPAASCRGLFCFIKLKKKIEYLPIPKKVHPLHIIAATIPSSHFLLLFFFQ